MGHEQHIRSRREIAVVHGEAFQLMLYRAEDGSQLWFWNSRDGVTPFGTSVDGKQYRHAMSGYPTRYQSVIPNEAEMVWVTHTPETWKEMQSRIFERYREKEDGGGADFKTRFPELEDWLKAAPFEHGQPHQMTREEFLSSTPEWMGKPS